MNTSLQDKSYEFAIGLHKFLKDIDPARWRQEKITSLKERLSTIESQLTELRERWSQAETPSVSEGLPSSAMTALKGKLASISATLSEAKGSLQGSGQDLKKRLNEFRLAMQPQYEDLAEQLRPLEIHVPSLRPTNYTRNLFHVGSAVSCLLLVELLLTPSLMLGITVVSAILAWGMEISRRANSTINSLLMKLFSPVSHPHEAHRVNSATWYTSALVVLALTGSPMLCALALAILGFGDPAAALIGRRWGKTQLINGRSLEGSAAFVIAASLACMVVFAVWHSHLPWGARLAIALVASCLAACAELLSQRVDDNFSIPVSAMGGAWLTAWLMNISIA